jgi:hypothetical protein
MEPGAQKVAGLDALAGLQVRLLLDNVPGVISPRGGAKAEPARDMDAAADLADRTIDKFELFGPAEPARDVLDDLCRP